jgi:guanylate kinase
VNEETFREKIRTGELAEWAKVHGHYYGTCARFIEAQRRNATDVVVDVDTQGAESLLSRYKDAISIFVSPPTMEILQERLVSRRTETREAIETRLANAREEMRQMNQYTHVLVNDDVERAVSEFLAVLNETGIHG